MTHNLYSTIYSHDASIPMLLKQSLLSKSYTCIVLSGQHHSHLHQHSQLLRHTPDLNHPNSNSCTCNHAIIKQACYIFSLHSVSHCLVYRSLSWTIPTPYLLTYQLFPYLLYSPTSPWSRFSTAPIPPQDSCIKPTHDYQELRTPELSNQPYSPAFNPLHICIINKPYRFLTLFNPISWENIPISVLYYLKNDGESTACVVVSWSVCVLQYTVWSLSCSPTIFPHSLFDYLFFSPVW